MKCKVNRDTDANDIKKCIEPGNIQGSNILSFKVWENGQCCAITHTGIANYITGIAVFRRKILKLVFNRLRAFLSHSHFKDYYFFLSHGLPIKLLRTEYQSRCGQYVLLTYFKGAWYTTTVWSLPVPQRLSLSLTSVGRKAKLVWLAVDMDSEHQAVVFLLPLLHWQQSEN